MSEKSKPSKTGEQLNYKPEYQYELPEPPHLSEPLARKVYADGDLLKLTEAERLEYYDQVCESLKLNKLTQPFKFIKQKIKEKDETGKEVWRDKLILYATKDCTDQLRKIWNISIHLEVAEEVKGVYVVNAIATTQSGRRDESKGAVALSNSFGPLTGDYLANAIMKTETKAKRRVTLSICGLGCTDESELETIPGLDVSDTKKPAKISKEKVMEKVDKPMPPPMSVTPTTETKFVTKTPPVDAEQAELEELAMRHSAELQGITPQEGKEDDFQQDQDLVDQVAAQKAAKEAAANITSTTMGDISTFDSFIGNSPKIQKGKNQYIRIFYNNGSNWFAEPYKNKQGETKTWKITSPTNKMVYVPLSQMEAGKNGSDEYLDVSLWIINKDEEAQNKWKELF